MPKYSSVQAYTDTNANLQTVSYERATGGKGTGGSGGDDGEGKSSKSGVVKPESVVNPYGSTAGAHSGEFHVYRKTRNAEMQRMAAFHAADAEQAKDEAFHNKLQRDAEQLDRKTNKKRNKRQKSKESKVRRKNLQQAGIATTTIAELHQQNDGDDDKDEDDEDEFPMIPLPAPVARPLLPNGGDAAGDQSTTSKKAASEGDAAAAAAAAATTSSAVEFANDGSFLEIAQQKLATATTEPTSTKKTLPGKTQERAL